MTLLYELILALPGGVAAAATGYLLLLLTAAAVARRGRRPGLREDEPPGRRVAVIVPAHNEEPVLEATLASLRVQEYPPDLLEVVVVADNCTDCTAAIAREAGVTVLERVDPERRGKGHALNWAIDILLCRAEAPDAFMIVDADTWVEPNFVRIMACELQRRADAEGCCALQGRYGVLNASDGWRATLMAGAFELINHVRPLGSDRLGFSVGLKGNGMGFTRQVLERASWGASVTEDIDYGLDLLERHGVRVGYVPEACVRAQMPVTSAQAASQRERWEGGRQALVRQRALPLLLAGLRRRDLRLCDAAFQLLTPPLAELGGIIAGWAALLAVGSWLHVVGNPPVWTASCAGVGLGLGGYVLGGLAVAGAPRAVYAALLRAPAYAVWKLVLCGARFLRRRLSSAPEEWVRTERLPIADLSTEGFAAPATLGAPER